MERGSKLFSSASLGTNGRSCATCHPDGKGLEDIADYDEKKMATFVNNCIEKALKGKPLASDSADMGSLVMYMNKLAKAKSK